MGPWTAAVRSFAYIAADGRFLLCAAELLVPRWYRTTDTRIVNSDTGRYQINHTCIYLRAIPENQHGAINLASRSAVCAQQTIVDQGQRSLILVIGCRIKGRHSLLTSPSASSKRTSTSTAFAPDIDGTNDLWHRELYRGYRYRRPNGSARIPMQRLPVYMVWKKFFLIKVIQP